MLSTSLMRPLNRSTMPLVLGGLGRSWTSKMLFDAEDFAQSVELVLAIEFALARGEPANGELFAVVDQQLGDFDRAGLVQRL